MAASADNACECLPPGSTHPSFAADDADIILCSQEGVHFRTHTLVLKLGSAWFRTLFTLPQSPLPSPLCKRPPPELIPMVEPADVLAALLGTACGHALPPLDALPFVEALLHAADKFDMPAALSALRLALAARLRVGGIGVARGAGGGERGRGGVVALEEGEVLRARAPPVRCERGEGGPRALVGLGAREGGVATD